MNRLAERFHAVRSETTALVRGLSAEDCLVQSMPEASPVKWHLAHTTWFFETFVLERTEDDFRPYDADFRVLFNSYYFGVGQRHPRAERGLLSRPALQDILAYRQDVERRMQAALQRPIDSALQSLTELGIQHEQQHQELILTDLLHHFSCNPLYPAYRHGFAAGPAPTPLTYSSFAGGRVEIGHDGQGFAFDNELPRHAAWLEPYALAVRPTSQGEYLSFIEDGGYTRPEFWLSDGWDLRDRQAWLHPLYWRPGKQEGTWMVFGLGGLQPLDPAMPVANLSYYETDAFARWSGARLPTEAEWENAAQRSALANAGQVWEWTQSAYLPYPGFAPRPGAVGEYNGKFMINQMVLRGASLATPAGHARISYRNFFPPAARWQFSGIRLARNP
jgi:ergothioneine biosynthesis protein EgtB